jgi:hypothetical protein
MAGDWIKVEKSTPRKPEVLRLAVLLNIHPDHAFGLCCRFWSWCDDNLTNSNAQGVTESLLDALLGRDGFASALVQVGWLQARQGSLVIPNFDLHLSQGAKSRALAARRQAQHRSRKSNAESVTKTSPEKRREENTSIGTGEPPVHAIDENPFYEPNDVPEQINPIARYSQPVQGEVEADLERLALLAVRLIAQPRQRINQQQPQHHRSHGGSVRGHRGREAHAIHGSAPAWIPTHFSTVPNLQASRPRGTNR